LSVKKNEYEKKYCCYCCCCLIVAQPTRIYTISVAKGQNAWGKLSDYLLRVEQMQLLRQQIAHELTASAKYDSKYLFHSLKTFNE